MKEKEKRKQNRKIISYDLIWTIELEVLYIPWSDKYTINDGKWRIVYKVEDYFG
jgi:hypothetical protein